MPDSGAQEVEPCAIHLLGLNKLTVAFLYEKPAAISLDSRASLSSEMNNALHAIPPKPYTGTIFCKSFV